MAGNGFQTEYVLLSVCFHKMFWGAAAQSQSSSRNVANTQAEEGFRSPLGIQAAVWDDASHPISWLECLSAVGVPHHCPGPCCEVALCVDMCWILPLAAALTFQALQRRGCCWGWLDRESQQLGCARPRWVLFFPVRTFRHDGFVGSSYLS